MIERYNAEKGGVERIDDGAPMFKIPVYFKEQAK